MTEDEARVEAAKREKNKSKYLGHKQWRAVNDEEKGWHVKLVDNPRHVHREAVQEARNAFFNGGTVGDFRAAAEKMLLAKCQMVTDEFEENYTRRN